MSNGGKLVVLSLLAAAVSTAQVSIAQVPPGDPVGRLSRRIDQGELKLRFDPVTGYLPAVLKALGIPVESQMAVFSKTGVQAMRTAPSNPRVLFFNDSVVVGWVRGGFIELASEGPVEGTVFYQLDQSTSGLRRRTATATPQSPITRREDCLHCHQSSVTYQIPGLLLRSVYPSSSGVPLDHAPQYDTDLTVPFEKLWGGWYVTGDTGTARHLGNLIAHDDHPELVSRAAPLHLDSLDEKCAPNTRLTPWSDIVALMVFEHQTHMTNLIHRIGRETRAGNDFLNAASELVDYMLFIDEPPLTGKVAGTSGFTEEFAARGPKDRKGRSLRQFDLEHRLMRYPCSYMIYGDAFNAIPPPAQDAIYRRLWQILSGRETSPRYAVLSPATRAAILEILRDTKPDLPAYFHPA